MMPVIRTAAAPLAMQTSALRFGASADDSMRWAGQNVASLDATKTSTVLFWNRTRTERESLDLIGKTTDGFAQLFHPVAADSLTDAVRAASAVIHGNAGATGDEAVMKAADGTFFVSPLYHGQPNVDAQGRLLYPDGVVPYYRFNGGAYYKSARQFSVDGDFNGIMPWMITKQQPQLQAIVGAQQFIDLSQFDVGQAAGASARQAVPTDPR